MRRIWLPCARKGAPITVKSRSMGCTSTTSSSHASAAGATLRQAGTEFASVTGVAHYSFEKRKLPRRSDDLVVVGGAPDFTTTIQAIQRRGR